MRRDKMTVCTLCLIMVMIIVLCKFSWKPAVPSPPAIQQSTKPRSVNWKLEKHSVNRSTLSSIPTPFQESLLSALPLNCHPGEEGVLKKRHSKFLLTLIEYAEEHAQMKSVPSSRTLTWHCLRPCGGLGDRIKGITYSLLLAIFSHRRLILFLDDMEEGKYLHPHMIDWTDKGAYQYLRGQGSNNTFSFPYNFSAVQLKIKGVLENREKDFEVVHSNRTNVIISINNYPQRLQQPELSGRQKWIADAVKWSGLSGLSGNDFDAVMGPAVRYLFKFDEEVFVELQRAKETLGLPDLYIALHIRTGIKGDFGEARFKPLHSQWKKFYACAVSTANIYTGEESFIYLATDSNKVKDRAWEDYSQRFRSLDNDIVHVDNQETFNKNSEKGLLAVWIELFIMAEAKIIVRGWSGYSRMAGILCGIQDHQTVNFMTDNCMLRKKHKI